MRKKRLCASGGTGERHFQKYFNSGNIDEPLKDYRVRFSTKEFEAGDTVNVLSGKYDETLSKFCAIVEGNGKTEYVEISKLTLPDDFKVLGAANAEQLEFENIKNQIAKIGFEFRLDTGYGIFDVDDIVDVKKFPKADFSFTKRNKPVLYLSHKAKKFQQYGGVMHFFSHPVVSSFYEDVLKKIKERRNSLNALPGDQFQRFLSPKNSEDRDLVQKMIFGNDFDTEKFSENNVHFVLHGTTVLDPKTSDTFELKTSHSIIPNPIIAQKELDFSENSIKIVGSYRFARRTGDIINFRTGIYDAHHKPNIERI